MNFFKYDIYLYYRNNIILQCFFLHDVLWCSPLTWKSFLNDCAKYVPVITLLLKPQRYCCDLL